MFLTPELVAAYVIRRGPLDYCTKAALDAVDAEEIKNEEAMSADENA